MTCPGAPYTLPFLASTIRGTAVVISPKVLLMVALAFALVACGQKGPLTLPQPEQPAEQLIPTGTPHE